MKVKASVIPFIPAVIAMLFFRVMSVIGVDESGYFLGMDRMVLSYTVIGIALGLFVVCIIINIFDRKTAPVYPLKQNFAAGAFAVMSGLAVMASSVSAFLETTADSEYYMMSIISAAFSIPAGLAFILMSKSHFTGKSTVSGSSVLFVFPALWGCTELVFEFLNATKVSISATDLTGLFCYIFITLYYFSHSMVVSRIKGRNPVKSCFIYGLPAAALGISHGVYIFVTGSHEGITVSSLLAAVQFIILGIYAITFIAEMTFNSYTKDELEIVDSLPAEDSSEEEDKYIDTKGYDDLVFSDSASATDPHVDPSDDYYSSAKGLDDFIMKFDADNQAEEQTEEEQPKEKKSKKAKKQSKKKAEKQVSAEPSAEVSEPVAESPELVVETVDEAPAADTVKPEPVAEAKHTAQPKSEPTPVRSELELELQRLSENGSAEPKHAANGKPVERVATSDDIELEQKESARLSEIDKLLQELDSKSE